MLDSPVRSNEPSFESLKIDPKFYAKLVYYQGLESNGFTNSKMPSYLDVTSFVYNCSQVKAEHRETSVEELVELPLEEFFAYFSSIQSPNKVVQLSKLRYTQGKMPCIALWKHMQEVGISLPLQKAMITVNATRSYLDLNAAQKGLDCLETLMPLDEGIIRALDQGKFYRKFLKLYARALSRNGEFEKQREILDELTLSNLKDWEPHMQMAIWHGPGSPQKYADHLSLAQSVSKKMSANAYTLLVHSKQINDQPHKAFQAVIDGSSQHPAARDLNLSGMSVAVQNGEAKKAAKWFEKYLLRFGAGMDIGQIDTFDSFETLQQVTKNYVPIASDPLAKNPLVSIITTVYNAAEFLDTAILSVLAQTYPNFELILIDDASTDRSPKILKQWAEKDKRIKVILKDNNEGTYVSKNRAIQQSNGEFLTFFDSDDWMHPKRLEYHLRHTHVDLVMTTSCWIRMAENGMPSIRRTGGFLHMNPASTFVRRKVFDRVGLFDSVRVGADSEFHWRVIDSYGRDHVEQFKIPLTIGREHANSLTTNGVAAFDENRISPVRQKYWDSWVEWHSRTSPESRFMAFPLSERPFSAPKEISVNAAATHITPNTSSALENAEEASQ